MPDQSRPKRKVERIVWHAVAHGDPNRGVVYDTTAQQIDQWYRDKGWGEIGCYAVIRLDETIERGRSPEKIPVGVKGINETTYYIVFSGRGDIRSLTDAQLEAGIQHTIKMLEQYRLTERFLKKPNSLVVMGHREVNILKKRRLAPIGTDKTCLGT